jgi:hypothetical protein
MMRQLNINMKIRVARLELLEKLKANRDRHATVYKEAKEGYLKAAKKALLARMTELESGKVKSLSFNLTVPSSQLSAYDTVIGMLEMSKDDTMEVSASEYRMFVQDEWDWMSNFLQTNSAYSATALVMSQALDSDE